LNITAFNYLSHFLYSFFFPPEQLPCVRLSKSLVAFCFSFS
jgi:hypothetical protein